MAARAAVAPIVSFRREQIFILNLKNWILYNPPPPRRYRQVRCGQKQGFCLDSYGVTAGRIQPVPWAIGRGSVGLVRAEWVANPAPDLPLRRTAAGVAAPRPIWRPCPMPSAPANRSRSSACISSTRGRASAASASPSCAIRGAAERPGIVRRHCGNRQRSGARCLAELGLVLCQGKGPTCWCRGSRPFRGRHAPSRTLRGCGWDSNPAGSAGPCRQSPGFGPSQAVAPPAGCPAPAGRRDP